VLRPCGSPQRRGALRRRARGLASSTADEQGWLAALAIVVIAVLMIAGSVTTVSVESSASAARRNADLLLARAAALSGAELFASSIEAVPATTWLPQCPSDQPPSTCAAQADIFPTSLAAVAHGVWFHLVGGGALPCTMTSTPTTATCIRLRDTLERDPDAPPGVSLYQITLQVDAVSNCRSGTWPSSSGGATPVGCEYARLLQRFSPRQYSNYLDFTGSELLDPALYAQDGGNVRAWLATCTHGSPLEPLADTVAAAAFSTVCATPAYLGAGVLAGSSTSSPGDTLDGPVATNDQTIYSCNVASAPPDIADIEAVSAVPSAELPRTVTRIASPCAGPPPPGSTEASSPPPASNDTLAAAALSQDRFGSPSAPVDVTVDLDGAAGTGGVNTYTVDGGPGRAWPATGVIYVFGDVAVAGSSCLPVTLGASGSIAIVGNLSYDPACPDAVTGLVATEGVTVVPTMEGNQITCWPAPVDRQCMTVQAAVIALGADDLPVTGTPGGGSFSLAGWDADASPLGSRGACDFDSVLGTVGVVDEWPLTDHGTPTAAWSGTGAADPGTLNGALTEGVTPGPLACQTSSPAMAFPGPAAGASRNGAPTAADGGFITTSVPIDDPITFSVAAWFKTTVTTAPGGRHGGGPLVSFADSATPEPSTVSDRQLWVGTDGRVYFGVLPAGAAPEYLSSPAGRDYADGRWHLAVATLSPAGAKLLVDGQLVAHVAGITAAQPDTGYWWIGAMEDAGRWPDTDAATPGLTTFDGDVGRVAVLDNAVPTATAATLYNTAQADPDRCAGLDVCALVFTGSFYERFRGAFGSYTTSAQGPQVLTGIAKVFRFDPRLSASQSPYFLGPVSGGWLRAGATLTGGLGS
jgi:hypothetical protein